MLDSLAATADSRAHFGRSAAPKIVPTVAIVECIEALDAYNDEPSMAFKAVAPAFLRLKRSFFASVTSANLRSAEVSPLLDYADELISRAESQTAGPLRAYLSNNKLAILQDSKKALKHLTEKQLYGTELASYLEAAISGEHSNRSAFRKLEKASKEVVAYISSQGRTPSLFIESLADQLVSVKGKVRPVSAVSKCLLALPDPYQVALVVDGTYTTQGLGRHKFYRVDHLKQIRWLPSSQSPEPPHQANSDLTRFCLKHWQVDSSNEPLAEARMDSQVLLIKVEAWDREQARHEALDRAEALVDLMNAEHRAAGFGVKRKVAVWQEGRRIVHQLSSSTPEVPLTRLLDTSRSPSVDRSLRFATRSVNERAGSMQTFFAWIALEYLGRGGTEKPQNAISDTVPALVSLVAIRQLIVEAWYLITKDLGTESLPEGVIKSTRRTHKPNRIASKVNVFDRRKFGHLILADDTNASVLASIAKITESEAKLAVEDFAKHKLTLSDHAQSRLSEITRTLSNENKLKEYAKEIENSADETMQRMRFVRNQTAHTASSTSTEHFLLSNSALMILDSVFETIPRLSGRPIDGLNRAKAQKRQWETSLGGNQKVYTLSFDPNTKVIH